MFLNDSFVNAVEHEYAVKYLESLGVETTQKNLGIIYSMAPFKKCGFVPSWEHSNDLASKFEIYPGTKSYLLKKKIKRNVDIMSTQKSKKGVMKTVQGNFTCEDVLKMIKMEIGKVKAKLKECSIENTSKMAQKQIEGIGEMCIETIRDKYLYPFNMDCNI